MEDCRGERGRNYYEKSLVVLRLIQHSKKEREERKKDEREKPLLFKRHKVVRFLISPKKKKVKIEVNKIMNPAFPTVTAAVRSHNEL